MIKGTFGIIPNKKLGIQDFRRYDDKGNFFNPLTDQLN